MGVAGAVTMPVGSALLLDLAPAERRQSVLAVNYTVVSVAYTLAVTPAGYVAEQGYGLLAALSAGSYLLVPVLYAVGLRGPLPLERASGEEGFYKGLASVFRDRVLLAFASIAFVFPFSMGCVVYCLAALRRRPWARRGLHRPGARPEQHHRGAASPSRWRRAWSAPARSGGSDGRRS